MQGSQDQNSAGSRPGSESEKAVASECSNAATQPGAPEFFVQAIPDDAACKVTSSETHWTLLPGHTTDEEGVEQNVREHHLPDGSTTHTNDTKLPQAGLTLVNKAWGPTEAANTTGWSLQQESQSISAEQTEKAISIRTALEKAGAPMLHGEKEKATTESVPTENSTLSSRASNSVDSSGLVHRLFKSWNPKAARSGILLCDARRKAKRERRKKHVVHVRFRLGKRKNTEAFHLLSPNSVVVSHWEMLMVVFMAYEVWAFPCRLALVNQHNIVPLLLIDAMTDAAFLCDMVLRLRTKVPAGTYKSQEEELSRPIDIAVAYFRHVFPFEVLPSVFYYFATATLLFECGDGLCWGWWAACIPRLLPRGSRLLAYFRRMERNLKVSVRALQGVRFSLIVLLSAHWIGCAFFWLARLRHFQDVTWVAGFEAIMPNFDRFEASFGTLYTLCLYRGFNALANIGYDVLIPQTESELLLSIVVMGVQVYMSALVLGTLLNYLVAKDKLAEAHKKRLEQITTFAEAKSIPVDLREKIFEYLQFQHDKNVQEKATVALKLPRSLEMKVADSKYRSLIDKCTTRGNAFFQCDAAFLNALLVKLRVLHVMPGEQFVSKSEIPRELYFVLHGTVHMVDDENRVMRAIRHDVPDIVPMCAEVPFFLGLNHPNSLRAKADEDLKLLVLDREDSDVLSQTYPEEFELIMENILQSQGLDEDGNDLEGAAETHDGDTARALLKETIVKSLHRRQQGRFAELIFAANNDDTDTVLMLARQGVNVDEVDHDGRTILHMACASGSYKLVETLIELEADKNLKDRWGSTPLQEAISHKQALVVGLLVQHKASLEAVDPAGEMCQAAASGDVEAVKRLLENSVDPCIGDYDKRTALHVTAAEGHIKVAEYLINKKADANSRDRWGGTPLQDAVQGAHLDLASLLRSKGGVLPDGMGVEQVCEAAASGDVRRLRLQHQCGQSMEVGDYDDRYPLHLAAAEGRVLAVSFLLSLSANPNCKDRWGGTPLDDALNGGTLYHMFCAKLISAWGGRPGKILDQAAVETMQKVAEIDIEEVRKLIKKLIAAGYDDSSAKRMSKTDLMVSMDASMRLLSIVAELFSRVEEVKVGLQSNVDVCSELAESLKDSVKFLARQLEVKHGAREIKRRGSLLMRQDTLDNKVSPLRMDRKVPSPVRSDSNPGPANSIVAQTMHMLECLETEEGMEMFGGEGIDSDEEMALYNEVDLMEAAQERALEAGLNADKLAAKDFQFLAMRIVEIGQMFKAMAAVAEAATMQRAGRMPTLQQEAWLTAEDLWCMLELLGAENMQATELDDILEEAQAFHSVYASGRVPPAEDPNRVQKFPNFAAVGSFRASRRARSPLQMRRTLSRRNNSAAEKFENGSFTRRTITNVELECDDDEGDLIRLPITSILSGSARFRRILANLNVDRELCSLMDTKLLQFFTEAELHAMLPCNVLKFAAGDTVLDSTAGPMHYCFVLTEGECTIEPTDSDVGFVKEFLREGDLFGAHAALLQQLKPLSFVVKATSAGAALQVRLSQLKALVGGDHSKCKHLAAFMAEAPENDAPVARTATVTRAVSVTTVASDRDRNHSTFSGETASPPPSLLAPEVPILSELEKRAMRDFVAAMDQLWANVSLGSNSVFRKQLYLIEKMLGEASSELFHTMFLAKPMPSAIDCKVFWKCCIDFLAEELFGEHNAGTILAAETEGDAEGATTDEEAAKLRSQEPEEESDDVKQGGCWNWLIAYLEGNILRHRYFDKDTLDLYRDAWLDVVGDTAKPMPAEKIPLLLGRVFLDFGHVITQRHAQEFLTEVGKDKQCSLLQWHELHKVLCDHRMGVNQVFHGPFIGSAINPTWPLLHWWRVLVRLCSIYYLIMVPARIAFLPWDSALAQGALSSDLVVDLFVTIDIVIRLNTAYRTHKATWSTNRLKILRKVPITAILASLPLDWFAYLLTAHNEVVCWLRLPRMLLVLACQRMTKVHNSGEFEYMVWLIGLLLHWSCCLWFYIGRIYGVWFPDKHISWIEVDDSLADLTFDREEVFGLGEDATVWARYLMSLYWVTATLTANGTVGAIFPQNLLEVWYTVLLLILNLTVVRAILGEVSSLVMSADKEIVTARERLEMVDSFITGNNLSNELQHEIRNHFQTVDGGTTMDQGEILPMLSRSLQLQVASFTCREFLEKVDFLHGISDSLRDSICVLLREVPFAPGQFLFHEAEMPNEIFFMTSGAVEECTHSEAGDVATENLLRTPSSVGELAFFFGVRHYFSARAGKNGATCLTVERGKFLSLMKLFPEEHDTISQNALRIMDKVNASRAASSRASKMSRGARSTRSGRSGQSEVSKTSRVSKSKSHAGDEGSVSSRNTPASAMASDIMEQMQGKNKGKDKISTLKAKRKHEAMLAFLRDCAAGNLDAVRKALEHDIQVNDVDPKSKRTALHVAACEGHDELVKFLLDSSADVGLKDVKGNTALNDAVRHHRDRTAQIIREFSPGVSLVLPGNTGGVNMCEAAYNGDLGHIKRLRDNGVGINETDYDGRSALHLASCEGHVKIVKFLLENGASIAAVDRFGGTPMEDAVRHRQAEVQVLLREAGARLEMSGKDYSGILCDAAAKGDLETIQILAKNGVDMSADDYDGRTALHLAASNEKIAVLEFLLTFEPRINVNPMDRFQDTPLGDALRHERPTATSMLRQAGGLEKSRPELADVARQGNGEERKKALREPAVQELMSASMEQHALRWVVEKLEPTMNDKTQDMLQAIDVLRQALEEVVRDFRPNSRDSQEASPIASTLGRPHPAQLLIGGDSPGPSSPAWPGGVNLTTENSAEAAQDKGEGRGDSEIKDVVAQDSPLLSSGQRNAEELFGILRTTVWNQVLDKHAQLIERAEAVVELSQSVRKMVLDGLSVFDDQESEAPLHCRIWKMASKRYAAQMRKWQHVLKLVSGLCVLARKLMREIIRMEKRKAKTAAQKLQGLKH